MALSWLHKLDANGVDVCCCPECEAPADTTLTYCTHCGYDIVRQARIDMTTMGRPVG